MLQWLMLPNGQDLVLPIKQAPKHACEGIPIGLIEVKRATVTFGSN